MKEDLARLREGFQSLSQEDRQKYLSKLSAKELRYFYLNPELFLFDKQIITGDQRYTILRCGRSFGKSFTGSAWIARKVIDGARVLGLVGPTHKDVEQVMVKAILSWFPKGEAIYTGGEKKYIKFKNYDSVVYCYSSDTEIRGPNLEFLWCDEICKWCDNIPEKIKTCFDLVDLTVRVGKNPQTLITSTPKPFPLFFEWQKKINEGNKRYKMYTGTMFDNPFLCDSFKESMIEKFGGTRLGKQELYGELLEDVEGAAWTNQMIDDCKMSFEDFIAKLKEKSIQTDERGYKTTVNKLTIVRTVVGVDPSVSDNPDSDECGIVIGCLCSDNHVYILNDYSDQLSTNKWAKRALEALEEYQAGMIVIEKNNGGDLVKTNIYALDPSAPIKAISSTQGKIDRALPVAALYERKQVHHVQPKRTQEQVKYGFNHYEKLETQMSRFTGNPKMKSPDRLDALVFVVHELRLNKTYIPRDLTDIGNY